MDVSLPASLALLRCVVGFLGERDNFGYWQSSFFSTSAKAFLAPVFARTQVLAQCSGVTQAAARVHDDRIGVGHVYHLFRLPEDLEQSIHRTLHDLDLIVRVAAATVDKDAAVAHLRETTPPTATPGIGPTLLGEARTLRVADTWRVVTAHYLRAFEQGTQVYPYFVGPK